LGDSREAGIGQFIDSGIRDISDLLGRKGTPFSFTVFFNVSDRISSAGKPCFIDLENLEDLAGLQDPMLALDLLVIRGKKRFGFEFRRTSASRVTPSMHSALVDLKLMRIDVIHAGENTFLMDKKIRAVALPRLLDDIEPL
jgi:hypothetical protein